MSTGMEHRESEPVDGISVPGWECANVMRYVETFYPDANLESTMKGCGISRLQQAWRCIETGKIEWRDVPTVARYKTSSR